MSPGFNAAVPWLIDLFGGRQSARTIHFLSASADRAFIVVHLCSWWCRALEQHPLDDHRPLRHRGRRRRRRP
jgi:thiosulfate reductase cytochrome b subunit